MDDLVDLKETRKRFREGIVLALKHLDACEDLESDIRKAQQALYLALELGRRPEDPDGGYGEC